MSETGSREHFERRKSLVSQTLGTRGVMWERAEICRHLRRLGGSGAGPMHVLKEMGWMHKNVGPSGC